MQSRCPAGGTAFGSSNFETRCEQSPFAAGTRSFRAPAMANRLINLVASFRSVYPDKRPPEAVSHGDVASTCPQKMTRVSGPPNSAPDNDICAMNAVILGDSFAEPLHLKHCAVLLHSLCALWPTWMDTSLKRTELRLWTHGIFTWLCSLNIIGPQRSGIRQKRHAEALNSLTFR